MRRFLLLSVIVTAVIAVAINVSALVTSRAASGVAVISSQTGYCFVELAAGGFVPHKLTRTECFSAFGGHHWCEGVGYTQCVYEDEGATSQSPTPVPPAEAPAQTPATPSAEPEPNASDYLNEPFGNWSEPGLCLSNDQRQFEIFAYSQTEDCFEKLENPQVCDYTGECFSSQRDLVDYLRALTN